jgi:hypothetical protein
MDELTIVVTIKVSNDNARQLALNQIKTDLFRLRHNVKNWTDGRVLSTEFLFAPAYTNEDNVAS